MHLYKAKLALHQDECQYGKISAHQAIVNKGQTTSMLKAVAFLLWNKALFNPKPINYLLDFYIFNSDTEVALIAIN
jgi:hypothetical protein